MTEPTHTIVTGLLLLLPVVGVATYVLISNGRRWLREKHQEKAKPR